MQMSSKLVFLCYFELNMHMITIKLYIVAAFQAFILPMYMLIIVLIPGKPTICPVYVQIFHKSVTSLGPA